MSERGTDVKFTKCFKIYLFSFALCCIEFSKPLLGKIQIIKFILGLWEVKPSNSMKNLNTKIEIPYKILK